jgi:hypothetical protein
MELSSAFLLKALALWSSGLTAVLMDPIALWICKKLLKSAHQVLSYLTVAKLKTRLVHADATFPNI